MKVWIHVFKAPRRVVSISRRRQVAKLKREHQQIPLPLRIQFKAADRLVFIDEGEIVEVGPPEEVFTNPSHERTRAFFDKILY